MNHQKLNNKDFVESLNDSFDTRIHNIYVVQYLYRVALDVIKAL